MGWDRQVDSHTRCLEQGAGARWPQDPQTGCCSRAPQLLSPAAEARTRWEDSVEAPANVTPLHPKSALPEQRRLLLVHPLNERCKAHEPFQHTKRDVSARHSVCGRGRHPSTHCGWGGVLGWGWQGTAASILPWPPRATLPPRQCLGPGLLTANTGRIYLSSEKPFVS